MNPIWIIVAIFIGLAVGGSVISVLYERKRTEAWKQVAGELGVQFVGDHNAILNRCGGMRVFQKGYRRRVKNAICGDAGNVRITVADYSFRTRSSSSGTNSGSKSKTHRRTVCVLESHELDVPHCYLRPEVMLFDALGSMFGGQDIDFADDPEFSRAFVLQGDNESAVRELFDAEVRAWFAARKGQRFHFEVRGNTLVFHTGRRRKPQEVREMMQQALEIMRLLGKQDPARNAR